MVKKIDNIWYEFTSPNNIPMVCLGKYNWILVDGYGWCPNTENFDGNVVSIKMNVGNTISNNYYRLEFNLIHEILSIDNIKFYCKVTELYNFVDRIRQANGWDIPPLYSVKPKGLDKYIRLQKINKLCSK